MDNDHYDPMQTDNMVEVHESSSFINIHDVSQCLKSFYMSALPRLSLHCALATAQCIVIGPVCGFVFLCVSVYVLFVFFCYHDNSKLRASIFTKLDL